MTSRTSRVHVTDTHKRDWWLAALTAGHRKRTSVVVIVVIDGVRLGSLI